MSENFSCIYFIKNIVTNQLYVGSAKNYRQRKNRHISYLRNNKHPNPILQNSWNKYKENNFIFKAYKLVDEKDLLTEEQKAIDEFIDFSLDFNICLRADRTGWTSEMRAKRSISAKRWWSESGNKMKWSENRKGSANSFFGRQHTAEAKNKIRFKNKGKKPPNCRKVLIKDKTYDSVTDAAKELNVSPTLILYRIKSEKYYLDYNYLINA
ncbi:MAG: GIY-YIG nuclease family protein [Lachnospiraceae bacterium]|nr:GIY-YIG nuclease family protein [Lachnospiraceae bacterium]